MNPAYLLVLAAIAGMADVIVILTWLGVKPQHIFNGKWWSMEPFSISRRKVSVILGLTLLSLTTSAVGLAALYMHVNFKPPKIVVQISPVMPAQMDSHEFSLRVPYINVGALPIIENKHGTFVKLSSNELSENDEDRLVRKMAIENAKNADVDKTEIERLDPRMFYTYEDKSVTDRDVQDVIDGKQRLYFSNVFKYRDEDTPAGKWGTTETCGYYYKSFQFYHNCKAPGNRIYIANE